MNSLLLPFFIISQPVEASFSFSFLNPVCYNEGVFFNSEGGDPVFHNDSKQQIEKKMLLLEGIALLKEPAHDILLDLMLRDDRMNYFEFTHYLNELMESGLIYNTNPNTYQLTKRGENAVHFFLDRAPEDALNALKSTAETLNIQPVSFSTVWETMDNQPILKLLSSTRGICLILSVDDRKLGDAIANAWVEQNKQTLADLLIILSDALFSARG